MKESSSWPAVVETVVEWTGVVLIVFFITRCNGG